MKRIFFLALGALAARWNGPLLAAPEDFDATTAVVGRRAGGLETPDNQWVTPAGTLVELPGVRPNALALSPDGRWLVTSGLKPELLVLDAATGQIRQRVAFPRGAESLGPVSELILGANDQPKLSFTGLTFSPDGRRIYLSDVNGDVKVFRVGATGTVSPEFSIPLPPADKPGRKAEVPTGIAVSPDGKKIYVAGNVANRLFELDAATGRVLRAWDVGNAPYDVALCGDKIYVSNWGGRRPDARCLVGPIGRNGTVRVDARSIASEGSVSVIELKAKSGAPREKEEILTGRHACALALSPDKKFLACANAGEDTVSIIDTRRDRVVETLCARQNPADLFGAQPNALAFDASGRKLFVCNGTQNAVAVFQFKPSGRFLGLFPIHRYRAGNVKMLGLIPVGWFPAGIVYDARRQRIDVANLKDIAPQTERAPKRRGNGAPGYNSKEYYGSLSLVPVPTPQELAADTRTALTDLRYPLLAQAKLPPRPGRPPVPVPERVGEPSVFQHVIYIIKENRTYDQVLGDVAEGNGDPALCVFGERVTPNQHQLVREFTLLDNTYCCSILSADGHQWTDSGIATDYVEREFAGWPRSYPAGADSGARDAMAYSPAGFIWNDAIEHGKTVVDFGEFTTPHHRWKDSGQPVTRWLDLYRDWTNGTRAVEYSTEPDLEFLRPYIATNYPGFDLTVPDAVRAGLFIEDFKQFEAAGRLPDLIIIWLPDDHTSGTKWGEPTPEAMVADNDLALGRIIETVSHSPFWTNTCIFAIEDDPQDGWDHVSGYRTTAYVASAYTRRHAVVHTQYNQTSLLRTVELILGLPPMNQLDATATPMFDCFTHTPDFTPFEAVANQVPLDQMNPDPRTLRNPQLRHDAYVSARLPLNKEDQCPEDLFNRILWRSVKGPQVPYPEWAVKENGDDD